MPARISPRAATQDLRISPVPRYCGERYDPTLFLAAAMLVAIPVFRYGPAIFTCVSRALSSPTFHRVRTHTRDSKSLSIPRSSYSVNPSLSMSYLRLLYRLRVLARWVILLGQLHGRPIRLPAELPRDHMLHIFVKCPTAISSDELVPNLFSSDERDFC